MSVTDMLRTLSVRTAACCVLHDCLFPIEWLATHGDLFFIPLRGQQPWPEALCFQADALRWVWKQTSRRWRTLVFPWLQEANLSWVMQMWLTNERRRSLLFWLSWNSTERLGNRVPYLSGSPRSRSSLKSNSVACHSKRHLFGANALLRASLKTSVSWTSHWLLRNFKSAVGSDSNAHTQLSLLLMHWYVGCTLTCTL